DRWQVRLAMWRTNPSRSPYPAFLAKPNMAWRFIETKLSIDTSWDRSPPANIWWWLRKDRRPRSQNKSRAAVSPTWEVSRLKVWIITGSPLWGSGRTATSRLAENAAEKLFRALWFGKGTGVRCTFYRVQVRRTLAKLTPTSSIR